ncbi:hypothetical protein ACQ4PT_026839 [Festuca glaucescens]
MVQSWEIFVVLNRGKEMSDEEHHFGGTETGTGTIQQQASNIRKNSYIVIQNRPCKGTQSVHQSLAVFDVVEEISASETGNYGHAQCHFVATDIFTGERFEDTVPSSDNCDVPHVIRTDYQLIDMSEDGYVMSLLTENGSTKDDLKLPTDESLAGQIKDGFNEGKDLVVTVLSSMGEEQICALKDIGPR